MKLKHLAPTDIEEIISLAWSDSTSFESITKEYSLSKDEVMKLMRFHQKPKTYERWRRRVRSWGARRKALDREYK